MKKYITVLFLYMSFAIPLISQPDNEISFQGILSNESGNAVPDGTYSIIFSIYDLSSGGSAIWSETQNVSVSNGEFSVYLGSITPITFSFDDQYWVGISIEEEAELSPRVKLSSSPYALYALTVPQNSINSYHIQTGGVAGGSINQMGANYGQALKWNGTQWGPADDLTGSITLPYYGVANTLSEAFVIENQSTGYAIAGANSYGNYGEIGGYFPVIGYNVINNNTGYLGGYDYAVQGNFDVGDNWGALGNNRNGVVGRKNSDNDGGGVFGFNTNGNEITIYNPQKEAGVIGLDYPSYNVGYLGSSTYGAYGEYYTNGNFGVLGDFSYGAYAENGSNSNYAYLAGASYPVYGYNNEYNNTGYLASDDYGAYGSYDGGNYGFLGSYNYGACGSHDVGNYGYLGSSSYGAYGYNQSTGNYGIIGSSSYGVYGRNSASRYYGTLGGSYYSVGAGCDNNSNFAYMGGDQYVVFARKVSTTGGAAIFAFKTDGSNVSISHSYNAAIVGRDYPSFNSGYIASENYGAYGRHSNSGNYGHVGSNSYGVFGSNGNSLNYGYLGGQTYGVYGRFNSSGNYGCLGTGDHGVYGKTTNLGDYGVYGENTINGTMGYVGGSSVGIYGHYDNGSTWAYLGGNGTGLYASTSGSVNKAVWGYNITGWAGYFSGDVYVLYDVGIRTSSPSYPLHVVGNAAKTTGSSWISLSDGRLKDVKSQYSRGIEEISQLNPIIFSFKKDNPLEVPSDEEYVGIIAQDLQDIFPEALSEYGDGYLAYNADPIFWALINAVKQQQEKIDSYENKFQQQEQKIDELIKMYDDLLKRIDNK